jgi:hypothetical protein
MNKRTSSTRAFKVERWPDVQLVRVSSERDVTWPEKYKMRPYFNRPPSHAWCQHFAELCEADVMFKSWRDGSAYCTGDETADVKSAFALHTRDTNAWFRRHLARMVAERPLYAQRLLEVERVRARASREERDAVEAHPYPAS